MIPEEYNDSYNCCGRLSSCTLRQCLCPNDGMVRCADTTTKKCTIVDKKPTTTTTVVVGDGVFKTKTEAETGMKSIKVCTSN